MSASVASIARPTTTAFATVPRPGRWRSGIHSSSSAKLVSTVAAPTLSGVCTDTPSAKTVHGELPRFDATSSASPAPKTVSPARSVASRRGDARHRDGTAVEAAAVMAREARTT
jgi:hypothetical protein